MKRRRRNRKPRSNLRAASNTRSRGNRFRLRSGGGTALKLGGNDVRIFLDGNLFLGYRTIFELSEKSAGTLFFTGNQYDGLPGSKADWRLIEQNNLYYGTEAR